MEMHPLYLFLDSYLIWFYRLFGHAWIDFFLGTAVLAGFALLLGEISIALAFWAVRKRIDQTAGQALKFQNLSVDALKAGDKEAYNAANKLANEAFGKSFFLQIALSAARLWPLPLALAWMQYRFYEVEFPLPFLPVSLGYIGVFILVYIVVYLAFQRVKYRMPYFRRLKESLDSYQPPASVLAPDIPPGAEGDHS